MASGYYCEEHGPHGDEVCRGCEEVAASERFWGVPPEKAEDLESVRRMAGRRREALECALADLDRSRAEVAELKEQVRTWRAVALDAACGAVVTGQPIFYVDDRKTVFSGVECGARVMKRPTLREIAP